MSHPPFEQGAVRLFLHHRIADGADQGEHDGTANTATENIANKRTNIHTADIATGRGAAGSQHHRQDLPDQSAADGSGNGIAGLAQAQILQRRACGGAAS